MKQLDLYENTVNLNKLAGQFGYKFLQHAHEDDTFYAPVANPTSRKTFENIVPQAIGIIQTLVLPRESGDMYLAWVFKTYANSGIKRWEDLRRVKSALELFHANKRRLQHKDINWYTNITDLEDAIERFKIENRLPKNIEKVLLQNNEAELLYNDETVKIVIPNSYRASCFYGRNTRWCTAGEDGEDYFNRYNKRGPLIIVLDKPNNARWQIHFPSEQYMDEKDHPIKLDNLIFKFPIPMLKVLTEFGYYQLDKKTKNGLIYCSKDDNADGWKFFYFTKEQLYLYYFSEEEYFFRDEPWLLKIKDGSSKINNGAVIFRDHELLSYICNIEKKVYDQSPDIYAIYNNKLLLQYSNANAILKVYNQNGEELTVYKLAEYAEYKTSNLDKATIKLLTQLADDDTNRQRKIRSPQSVIKLFEILRKCDK